MKENRLAQSKLVSQVSGQTDIGGVRRSLVAGRAALTRGETMQLGSPMATGLVEVSQVECERGRDPYPQGGEDINQGLIT